MASEVRELTRRELIGIERREALDALALRRSIARSPAPMDPAALRRLVAIKVTTCRAIIAALRAKP